MASDARARSAAAASATTPTTADATSTMFDLGKFGARGADGLLEETGRGTLNPFDMDGSERETVRLKPGMTRGQFALLLASECALAVGLFALYTMIGFGDDVYSELANDGNWRLSWAIAGGSMALFAVLWILDAMEAARSRGRAIRRTVTFLFASVGVGGCCLLTGLSGRRILGREEGVAVARAVEPEVLRADVVVLLRLHERLDARVDNLGDARAEGRHSPVSYTHLTLPTKA